MYKLQAIALIVEHRTCQNCKKEFEFPSNVVLELFDPNNNKTVLSNPKMNYLTLDLPRKRRVVNTSVPACQECFQEYKNGSDQLPLFNEPKTEFGLELVSLDTKSQKYLMNAAITTNQRMNWLGGKDATPFTPLDLHARDGMNGKVVVNHLTAKQMKDRLNKDKKKKEKPILPSAASYF